MKNISRNHSSTAPRQVVLLWVIMIAHFRELSRLARVLSTSPTYEPVIYFAAQYAGFERDQALCDAEGIRWISRTPQGFSQGPLPPPSITQPRDQSCTAPPVRPRRRRKRPLYQRIVRRCRNPKPLLMTFLVLFLVVLWRVLNLIYRIRATILNRIRSDYYKGRPWVPRNWIARRMQRSQLRYCQELVNFAQPALLVFPEDNVEFETAPLIQTAHQLGIPSVIVPYTICNASEPAESYYHSPLHQAHSFANWLVARQYPQWVHRHRGRDLIRLPGHQVRAKLAFDLAPPIPWILNSGHADAIALESPALRDYYLRAGLPSEQLRVVGSVRLDVLAPFYWQASAHRRALLERLGWTEGWLIVTAIPPDQGPQSRPGCQFSSYEALVSYWVKTLATLPESRVLLNPHPRSDPQLLQQLERDNIRLIRGDVAPLIPLCDLYVASISATIPMALACGKPVINYDVYCYGYGDFASSPLIQEATDRLSFESALQHEHSAYRKRMINHETLPPDPYWGSLDGQCSTRLLELFDQLLANASGSSALRQAG